MAAQGLPYSEATERSLLGAMLLSRQVTEGAIKLVSSADFYSPGLGLIFDSIEALYKVGEDIDPVTVADDLHAKGQLDAIGGPPALIELQSECPATSSWKTYCKRLVDYSAFRNLALLCEEMAILAASMSGTPEEVAAQLGVRLAEVFEGSILEEPEGLSTVDSFLDRPMEARPPWVIPGLLRVGWRVMVVASEGVGKTVLFRQIGLAAAQGIHPLHFGQQDPCRVLIVDLENPDDSIVDVCEPIRSKILTRTMDEDYDPGRAWLWHRPDGIDLRSRRDRAELEAVIAKVRPDLVCLGPIYKAYSVSASESDEIAAKEIMQVFDDLRKRYSFGLLLEHHAPKGVGKARVQTPYGSSLWMRWPEIGIGLNPSEPGSNETLRLERWRGDRLKNSWPIEISRGREGDWMWQGTWPAGTFAGPGEPKVPTVEPIRSSGYLVPAGGEDEPEF